MKPPDVAVTVLQLVALRKPPRAGVYLPAPVIPAAAIMNVTV
ncbi:MAG: hypothetical protein PHT99_06585 [Methanoregula sp.]|nr:hypothetical protein [Methanoregula sp.]